MFGDVEQRLAELGVRGELLRSSGKPQVEAVFGGAKLTGQLGMKTLGIIDQISRMHLEEARQHHARGVGEMRASSAFDLRQVRLAQARAKFFLQSGGELLLRHLAIHVAESAFDQAQVPEFFAKFHIAISNYSITDCNVKTWISKPLSRLGAQAVYEPAWQMV